MGPAVQDVTDSPQTWPWVDANSRLAVARYFTHGWSLRSRTRW